MLSRNQRRRRNRLARLYQVRADVSAAMGRDPRHSGSTPHVARFADAAARIRPFGDRLEWSIRRKGPPVKTHGWSEGK